MKHCHTCNREVNDQVRFCPFCGSAISKIESDPSIGDKFAGEFRIERKIREGNPTTLFAATQLATETKVILAILPRRLINAIGEESLARQLQAAARLRHPCVAAIRDVRLLNTDTPFLVLEYMDGVSLAEKLKQGTLELKDAVRIINQIASALEEAHLRGIPFCAPSSESVWLIEHGAELNVKVTDLNVSRLLAMEDLRLLKESGRDAPGLRYLAPELTGQDGSSSADVYSLGVIAYEMIAGGSPFPALNPLEAVAMDAHPKPLPDSILAAPKLNGILERALKLKPEDRQSSVTILGKEIEDAVHGAPSHTCVACGFEMPLTDLFCQHCGSRQVAGNEGQFASLRGILETSREETWMVGNEWEMSIDQAEAEVPCVITKVSRDDSVDPMSPSDIDSVTSDSSSEPEAIYLDENVQFTVYRPKSIRPLIWAPMLAFAHLSERRPEAPHSPDPIEEVKKQARMALGEHIDQYQQTSQDSAQAVPREGEITFIPAVPGIEFNPPSRTFRWEEDVHKEEFRLRAAASLDQQTARGQLSVFLGSILLAEVTLSIRVDSNQLADAPTESSAAQAYRKIFASYSHKDIAIVEQFEHYAKALGDRYLRDVNDLRAGQVWSDQLGVLISEANVFQLFWSSNSMKSEFVKQEWEYALGLRRSNFVRPTYWEDPLPEWPEKKLPPDELVRLHFQQIALGVKSQVKAPALINRWSDVIDHDVVPPPPMSAPPPAATGFPIQRPPLSSPFLPQGPTVGHTGTAPPTQVGARLSATGDMRDGVASGQRQFSGYPSMAPPPSPGSRSPIAIFIALGCLVLAAIILFAFLFFFRML